MRRTAISRALVSALTIVALGGLAACGSADEPADEPSSAGGSSDVGGDSDAGDEADSGDEADGGDEADEVSLPDDVCSLLTADEVSTATGRTVTIETGPSGDCEFSEEDPRGLSGLLGVVPDAAGNGGYDAYLSGVVGAIPDAVQRDLTGLGDAAATYTGVPGFGGSTQVMAGGVVDRGSFLEQTTLTQASDMTAEELDPIAEALLRLLDSKLG